MGRVEPGATAWWHRKSPYGVTLSATWSEPEEDAVNKEWLDSVSYSATCPNQTSSLPPALAKQTNAKVRLVGTGPSPNGNDGISPESIKRCYAGNYQKLQELKAKWDPTNFFRYCINIPLPEKASP